MQYMHSGHAGAQRMNAPYGAGGMGGQRPPNVQVGPEGMPMGPQEWRQYSMSQQQNMNFSGGNVRPGFNINHQGKYHKIFTPFTQCIQIPKNLNVFHIFFTIQVVLFPQISPCPMVIAAAAYKWLLIKCNDLTVEI